VALPHRLSLRDVVSLEHPLRHPWNWEVIGGSPHMAAGITALETAHQHHIEGGAGHYPELTQL
jgi:energy-converting hydrogenase Eha subunit A